MPKDILGEFEHHVLLALMRLEPKAYSAPIVEELEAHTGRTVAASSVYISLRRLEDQGLVRSEMRPPADDPDSRPRRYFRLTRAGLELLRESRRRYVSLWRGLEPRLGTE